MLFLQKLFQLKARTKATNSMEKLIRGMREMLITCNPGQWIMLIENQAKSKCHTVTALKHLCSILWLSVCEKIIFWSIFIGPFIIVQHFYWLLAQFIHHCETFLLVYSSFCSIYISRFWSFSFGPLINLEHFFWFDIIMEHFHQFIYCCGAFLKVILQWTFKPM